MGEGKSIGGEHQSREKRKYDEVQNSDTKGRRKIARTKTILEEEIMEQSNKRRDEERTTGLERRKEREVER